MNTHLNGRSGQAALLPDSLRDRFNAEEVAISPTIELELGCFHDVGRITAGPEPILAELRRAIRLRVDETPFAGVVGLAVTPAYSFTRDPFDRLIGAQAAAAGAALSTKVRALLSNLGCAIWD